MVGSRNYPMSTLIETIGLNYCVLDVRKVPHEYSPQERLCPVIYTASTPSSNHTLIVGSSSYQWMLNRQSTPIRIRE